MNVLVVEPSPIRDVTVCVSTVTAEEVSCGGSSSSHCLMQRISMSPLPISFLFYITSFVSKEEKTASELLIAAHRLHPSEAAVNV